MKKVLLTLAISFIYGTASFAAAPVAEQMAEILTSSYGAEVKVEADEGKCSVNYPATTVKEDAMDFSKLAMPGLGAAAPTPTPSTDKTSEYIIPATTAECKRIEDFKSYAQYEVSVNSLHKFLAQVYNNFNFAFVKDLTAGSYKEEIKMVPEIGVVSYSNLHVSDLSYIKKDETTGLKSEIGNLAALDSQQQVTEENNLVKNSAEMSMDSLNLAFPIFSLHIKSEKHRSEITYEMPADTAFNYQQMVDNVPFLSAAKSSALVDDVKIGVDMFGFNLGFDAEIKNTIQRENEEYFYILGQTTFNDIKIDGGFLDNFISPNIQPKQIELKYSIKNIAAADVIALSEIPDEDGLTDEEKEKNDEKAAEIFDKIAQKIKLTANAEVKFAAGDISGIWVLEDKNGYLYGAGKIKVNNLYGIFPEQKQCVNNPQADKIPDCNNMIFSELKNVIDITKNDSETVYKYTEQGVFKNNVRIADPVKLDFKKMYLEKQQEDREKQAKIEDMMNSMQNGDDLQP